MQSIFIKNSADMGYGSKEFHDWHQEQIPAGGFLAHRG